LVLDGTSITANSSGWYDQNGNHESENPNYIAGICGSSDSCYGYDVDYRDFFIFAIPSGSYSQASLQLYNPSLAQGDSGNGYVSATSSLTYTNWDVSTDLGTLAAQQLGLTAVYADLGSGVLFASTVMTPDDDGQWVNIQLDAAALNSINAAAGGDWAVGGAVNSAVAPEPSSIVLFATGFLGMAGAIRRKLTA